MQTEINPSIEREKPINLSKIIRQTTLSALAFESLTRMGEVYLPAPYSEIATSVRVAGALIGGTAGACALGLSPFIAFYVYLRNNP